ncbi:MAG: efflux RND transporter periplasmic adaptor subunit [Acidobacteriaceae bacterium]|jgi:multidrug efflux system membrane fusion protein|nr:efflux RND transporter periplasmic adaptor subunit [Acidobacteriaceae bacterium]
MRYPFVPVHRLAIVAIALSTAAGGCSGTQAEAPSQARPAASANSSPAVPVTVAKAVRKSMPVTLNVIGTVVPAKSIGVYAQVTGQITTVSFAEGDNVQSGAVLFEIDRRPLEAALKQAEAALQRDNAQAENARAVAKRTSDLAARGITTAEQLQAAQTAAAALDATIEADRATIENAKVQLQYATIKAPLTGRTGALIVHPGSLVRANDTAALVLINQISPINVEFSVPEAQLPELRRYRSQESIPIDVATPDAPTQRVRGRITFLDNTVDQTTGMIKVKGSFTNDDRRLWPGQYVNVTITLSTDKDVTVVPTLAVQSDQQGSYAFVITANNTAEMRKVVVKRVSGDETIVASGVSPDETVVTDGHLRLVAGSRVSIKSASEAAQ